jgi:hypothetical protein
MPDPVPELPPEPEPLTRRLEALLPSDGRSPSVRLAHALGWANLLYLGLLPAAATFWVVFQYGSPGLSLLGEFARAVVGVTGVVAVAVELAALVTYTRFSNSVWAALLVLLDGPLLALLSASSTQGMAQVAVQAFLIDGTAVWVAIGLLSLTTDQLEGGARLIPFGLSVVVLASLAALFGPYLAHELPHTFQGMASLVGGLIWATAVNLHMLSTDKVARNGNDGSVTAYLVAFSVGWLVVYGVAVALHLHR